MKTIKVTFCQKAEEYYRDINDYKGDWPGIKFSSSLQCKFQCNLNVHALFLLSYCPLSYQYAYISSKSGILKIAVFELKMYLYCFFSDLYRVYDRDSVLYISIYSAGLQIDTNMSHIK